MLIHPTVERLRALGLTAMADAFIELQNAPDAGELSREDWLGLLVDREATSRENKRLARPLRQGPLRPSSVGEDVALRPPPAVCARPGCASLPSSRTSTSAPTAASTGLSSSSSRAVSGFASIIIFA